jgi:spore germination cell wall hydrolase CwlJ-like protein
MNRRKSWTVILAAILTIPCGWQAQHAEPVSAHPSGPILTESSYRQWSGFEQANIALAELPPEQAVSEQQETTDPAEAQQIDPHPEISAEELEILAKVIYSEARGEPFEGKVAVGSVVLNRTKSTHFPDTIGDVVFQRGAFTAVKDGQYSLEPDQEAYEAAIEAVNGWDPTGDALYYYNPEISTSKWIRSRTPTTQIGNHVFAI